MNKKVLITGASGGIGYEMAKVFAEKSYDLIMVARRREIMDALADEVKKKFGVNAHIMVQDLAHEGSGLKLYQEINKMDLKPDIVINNAGLADYGKFVERGWEKVRDMIMVNIMALTEITRMFAGDMVKRGYGKILNVASTAAFQPGPLMAVYFASKAYVLSFSEAISNELKGTGVTVTALCPGPTQTGFEERAEMHSSRMFRLIKPVKSEKVARYAYSALMTGKVVAIQGLLNKFSAMINRFIPRSIIRFFMRKISDPVKYKSI
jgi:short-subunit dehydrogenase